MNETAFSILYAWAVKKKYYKMYRNTDSYVFTVKQ